MGVLHTIALVANTTSRYPFATGEWRGHFKNVGMYSRRIAYRDSCYMNKQVYRILEITLILKTKRAVIFGKNLLLRSAEGFGVRGLTSDSLRWKQKD